VVYAAAPAASPSAIHGQTHAPVKFTIGHAGLNSVILIADH
jgi:hypothetical protein